MGSVPYPQYVTGRIFTRSGQISIAQGFSPGSPEQSEQEAGWSWGARVQLLKIGGLTVLFFLLAPYCIDIFFFFYHILSHFQATLHTLSCVLVYSVLKCAFFIFFSSS